MINAVLSPSLSWTSEWTNAALQVRVFSQISTYVYRGSQYEHLAIICKKASISREVQEQDWVAPKKKAVCDTAAATALWSQMHPAHIHPSGQLPNTPGWATGAPVKLSHSLSIHQTTSGTELNAWRKNRELLNLSEVPG